MKAYASASVLSEKVLKYLISFFSLMKMLGTKYNLGSCLEQEAV